MDGPVRFGDVLVDVEARRVTRQGEPEHLEPQAFDLLVTLIDAADRVVPKPELLDRVWGDQFVSESALTTRIKEVRRAVGDDGQRQAVIRNVRGRGYQFVAELDRSGPDPSPEPADTSLIGRDETLVQAADLVSRTRLVTITGTGGVGKTTLAARLARDVGARCPDGAIVAQLAPIRDAAAVDSVVRRAAGVVDEPSGDVTALAALDALLVLDNCEHVVGAAADLAARLVAAGGPLRVVATSRERLGIPDEQVMPLNVLGRDAAVELFVARARAARPDFTVTPDASERIGELVDSLDRLPLAIEMAAARVSAFTVDELATLITDELNVLGSADRTAAERHRTLGALVAWSERLLDEPTRRVLTDCSIFSGTVSRDDLTGVVDGDPGATMARVADLVDRSLIVADTSGAATRYRMLVTVRSQVARSRPVATALRHARWFLRVAELADAQLRTAAEGDAQRRLDSVVDELRAAHAWLRAHDPKAAARLTGALDHYAHARHWSEPAEWAADLLEVLDPDEESAAPVLAALAGEAAHGGDLARVEELALLALRHGDPRSRALALESLVDAALYRGDFEACRRWADELEQVAKESGDLHAISMAMADRVICAAYAGEGDALALAASLDGDRSDLAPSDRGWIEYVRGEASVETNPEAALGHYRSALELANSVDHRFLAGVSSVSMLALQARTGPPLTALRSFPPVLADYRRSGDVTHLVTALRNLVVLLVRVGEDAGAAELLGFLDRHARDRPSFGRELERLAAARSTVADRLADARRRECAELGSARTLHETVDAAIAIVARHT